MPSKSRRTISRRVVGRRVVGSANPVARWGRESKSTCMDSIGGFFIGLLLFFVTFAVPFSAARTEKDSVALNELPVTPVAQATAVDGKAIISGTLTAGSTIQAPIVDLDKPLLAYRYSVERFEPHIETRTETRTVVEGGQEVEYTEEIEEEVMDWATIESDSDWAALKLGTIAIDRQECNISALDKQWQSVYSDSYKEVDTGYEMRENLDVLYSGVDVLLAAEFSGGKVIAEPDFYLLHIGTKEEMVAQEHTKEETNRWLKIVISVILWTISLNLMVGPAMILINIIPIKQLSGAIRGVITFFSLVTACIITFVTYVFVKYWWVIALLLVVLAVVVIVNVMKHKEPDPDLELDDLDPVEE